MAFILNDSREVRQPIDLASYGMRLDYWAPTNTTDTPDGSLPVSAGTAEGEAVCVVPPGTLTVAGDWRLQAVLISAEGEVPAVTKTVNIAARGM